MGVSESAKDLRERDAEAGEEVKASRRLTDGADVKEGCTDDGRVYGVHGNTDREAQKHRFGTNFFRFFFAFLTRF